MTSKVTKLSPTSRVSSTWELKQLHQFPGGWDQASVKLCQTPILHCACIWVCLLCTLWSKKFRRADANPHILILHVHRLLGVNSRAHPDSQELQQGDLFTAPFRPGIPCLFLSCLIPKANCFGVILAPTSLPYTQTALQKGRPVLALFT